MRKKLLSALASASLVLALATGCQATSPDITPDQARAFQSRVLAVTAAVADGGYAAALEALAVLETELDAAAAEGSVSFARHQRIEAAMNAVRADVQAAIDAEAEREPAPVEPAPVEEEKVAPGRETDTEKEAREDKEEAEEEEAEKDKEEADE